MKLISKAMRFFVASAVIVVFVEVVYEVISRYVFLTPVPWGAEVSQTLLVWITFIGAACAFETKKHMAIDILVRNIKSLPLRRILTYFADLVIFMLFIFGAVAGVSVVMDTWYDKTTALQIPAGIIYLSFPFSMVLMALTMVWDYVKNRGRLDFGEAEEDGGDNS